MLTPPSKGFAAHVSVNVHNVQLDAMVDWLEGCITFIDTEITHSDVKDMLVDEGYYREQDFAQMRIDDAWKELRRRVKCLGPVVPYAVESKRLKRMLDWKLTPAYSFCLMLAMQAAYRSSFMEMFGADYSEQGQIFEELTTEALRHCGLTPHSTGWSHLASNSVLDKVAAVARHIGEPHNPLAIGTWTAKRAKDCGLDVVCLMPFPDGWAGRPLYFVQCASGENWEEKCATPIINQWKKLLDLATEPRRGIAHPFVLLKDDFRRTANVEFLALVLDRHRVSRPGAVAKSDWPSATLTSSLNDWTEGRLPALEKNESD